MGFQGQSNSAAMVLFFYLEYSQGGKIWDKYGYRPPVEYIVRISRTKRHYFSGLGAEAYSELFKHMRWIFLQKYLTAFSG